MWFKALILVAASIVSAAVAPSVLVASVPAAEAAPVSHYYFELGGTGSAEPAPECTSSYTYANQALNGGIAVPVCYPASAGPLEGGDGTIPGLGAPSYDASVKHGVENLLSAVESRHRTHPDARFTITGYSQGAEVAGDVLAEIAGGRTGIPRSLVDGMLYGDPRQPGTGVESIVPKGVSALGFSSSGPGPVNFPGIPVERFCIRTDGVCDASSPLSVPGYLTQHPRYPQRGGIISQTLAHDGGNGTTWYAPSS
ncbi:MAG: PE-PPE domain-containing protein [Nocardiopsaceae bacterium]|nr:PE-PPE domain-containing protein [Nocardiopsaceae bacterium]